MEAFELPGRAMFDVCVPVRRREQKLAIDGRLDDWPHGYLLPDLAAIDGTPSHAAVYMGWDQKGLYFGLDVPAKRSVTVNPSRPHKADAFLLWIDTRDVRDAMRAGRFCHHFIVLPRPGGSGAKAVMAWQAPIRRAREQAPICDARELLVASAVRKDGYSLELAIPASCLNGYDPAECSRLGLTYMVTDTTHGHQLWNVPPRIPFEHDPSMWAAIELVG